MCRTKEKIKNNLNIVILLLQATRINTCTSVILLLQLTRINTCTSVILLLQPIRINTCTSFNSFFFSFSFAGKELY
ncbi:hypothetical protein CICLE_v10010094mg [Citrus x clementina]|uniref:Uncharacterized protein n=1 Tax=Citrus clementina TaxID=85681 RepID=V4TWB3_CITCL|nr:hypothetical protein CICLE_v10010094mg [Citrus x clementina]